MCELPHQFLNLPEASSQGARSLSFLVVFGALVWAWAHCISVHRSVSGVMCTRRARLHVEYDDLEESWLKPHVKAMVE